MPLPSKAPCTERLASRAAAEFQCASYVWRQSGPAASVVRPGSRSHSGVFTDATTSDRSRADAGSSAGERQRVDSEDSLRAAAVGPAPDTAVVRSLASADGRLARENESGVDQPGDVRDFVSHPATTTVTTLCQQAFQEDAAIQQALYRPQAGALGSCQAEDLPDPTMGFSGWVSWKMFEMASDRRE